MKKITRIFTLILAIVLSISNFAFAAEAAGTGEITIQLSSSLGDTDLALFRFFDWDEESGTFVTNDMSNLFCRLNPAYDQSTIVGVVSGMSDAEFSTFAKAVETFAKDTSGGTSSLFMTKTKVPNGGSQTVKNLEFGYYFIVDITAGRVNPAAVGITNLTDTATIKIKGETAAIDKNIVEGTNTYKSKGYSIGDTIKFRVDGKVPDLSSYKDGFVYKITDTMSEGLDFNPDSVTVTIGGDHVVDIADMTLNTEGLANGATFELTLDKLFEHYKAGHFNVGETINIEYTATLNNKASSDKDENNKAILTYSNNPDNYTKTTDTHESTVRIYTYEFDITKKDGLGEYAEYLAGAEFYLQNADGKYMEFEKATNGTTGAVTYKPTGKVFDSIESYTPTETNDTLLITGNAKEGATIVDQAKYTIVGLKAGNYTLVENKAPDGYTIKAGGFKFTITEEFDPNTNVLNSITLTPMPDSENWIASTGSKEGKIDIIVVNTENGDNPPLPETGGMGTTVFTVGGIAIMIGAICLFVLKKKAVKQ